MKQREKDSAKMIEQARIQMGKLSQPLEVLPSIGLEDIEKLINDIKIKLSSINAIETKEYTQYQFIPKTSTVEFGCIKPIDAQVDMSTPM